MDDTDMTTLESAGDVWHEGSGPDPSGRSFSVRDENRLLVPASEIIARIRDLQSALSGLVTDAMEIREALGICEGGDVADDAEEWWADRVTAGTYNLRIAQGLLGMPEED